MARYRGRHRRPATLRRTLMLTVAEWRLVVARHAAALTMAGLFLLFALIG